MSIKLQFSLQAHLIFCFCFQFTCPCFIVHCQCRQSLYLGGTNVCANKYAWQKPKCTFLNGSQLAMVCTVHLVFIAAKAKNRDGAVLFWLSLLQDEIEAVSHQQPVTGTVNPECLFSRSTAPQHQQQKPRKWSGGNDPDVSQTGMLTHSGGITNEFWNQCLVVEVGHSFQVITIIRSFHMQYFTFNKSGAYRFPAVEKKMPKNSLWWWLFRSKCKLQHLCTLDFHKPQGVF